MPQAFYIHIIHDRPYDTAQRKRGIYFAPREAVTRKERIDRTTQRTVNAVYISPLVSQSLAGDDGSWILWHVLWAFYGARWRARQRFGLKMREKAAYARLATRVLDPQRDLRPRQCRLQRLAARPATNADALDPALPLPLRPRRAGFFWSIARPRRATCAEARCGSTLRSGPSSKCKSCKIAWSRDVNASRAVA